MIQIRKAVFETNSSSTHSIAIPKNRKDTYPGVIHFSIGEFGWAQKEADPASYLYTAILTFYETDNDLLKEKLNILTQALNNHDIRYTMDKPKWKYYFNSDGTKVRYLNWNCGSIDHAHDLEEFLEAVFKDEETLLNFIFYGYVFTGNDNTDNCGYLTRDEETYIDEYYDSETKKWISTKVKNEYYDPKFKEYDWYWKGN